MYVNDGSESYETRQQLSIQICAVNFIKYYNKIIMKLHVRLGYLSTRRRVSRGGAEEKQRKCRRRAEEVLLQLANEENSR